MVVFSGSKNQTTRYSYKPDVHLLLSHTKHPVNHKIKESSQNSLLQPTQSHGALDGPMPCHTNKQTNKLTSTTRNEV